MLASFLVLSAALVTAPVFISDVKALRESGHLRVEVRGDGGIDPENARTIIDAGRLLIYLEGTHVRADNRAWQLEDGAGEIRAHRHLTETELVVPLDGNGCTGPVELAGTPSGITALVGCEGRVVASKASGARASKPSKAPPRPAEAERSPAGDVKAEGFGRPPQSARPERSERSERGGADLAALVALPADAVADADANADANANANEGSASAGMRARGGGAPEVKPAASKLTTTSAALARPTAPPLPVDGPSAEAVPPPSTAPLAVVRPASAAASAQAASTIATTTGTTTTTGTAKPAAATTASAPPGGRSPTAEARTLVCDAPAAAPAAAAQASGASPGGSLRAVAIPAGLLAALAAAAFLIVRRRRFPLDRRIQILETASLGPKRSLVIARIGDETLVLGISEAGITLLRSSAKAEGQPTPSAQDPALDTVADDDFTDLSQPIDVALADIPEPGDARTVPARSNLRRIEGGLLDLFGKRGAGTPGRALDAAPLADEFGDLLEDSVEDQELRRKLAAGISTRVR